MSVYQQLNDKKWLRNKYFNEGLSTVAIAELVGARQSNSVRQALIKFGWTPRDRREAQVLGRLDSLIDDAEVINGTLLGDAHIRKSNQLSTIAAAYYSKKSKNEDYGKHIADLISGQGDYDFKLHSSKQNYKGKISNIDYWTFRTRSSPQLNRYFDSWYPKRTGFKKVVPKNLILTPRTILYWFMDDGYTTFRNRNKEYKGTKWTQKKQQVILQFCTECFTKRENDFLVKQLKGFSLNAAVRPHDKGTGWRISVNQSSTQDFFDLIGECPVVSMQYKWKLDN